MLKWLAGGLVAAWICQQGAIMGMLVQPWAPWWFSGKTGQVAGTPPDVALPAPATDPGNLNPPPGFVTDAQRYQLARAAGWSLTDAITAAAISIAEDGSGNPSILSPRNSNGTFDLGLWQINSSHWAEFGGQQALVDSRRNAQAAHVIYGRQGWCAWSTYESSCGIGHTTTYRAFLARATAAAHISDPTLAIASTAPLFSQSLKQATRGYLTDYPDVPGMLTLWTSKGIAGISLQRNCTLSQGVQSGVNVMAGYSSDDVTVEGQTVWLSAIGVSVPPDDPPCEALLEQWIGSRPCVEIEGVCDIAALDRP